MASLSGVRVGRIVATIGVIVALALMHPTPARAALSKAYALEMMKQLKSPDPEARRGATRRGSCTWVGMARRCRK
jgi:hypothetical protein